MTSSVSGKVIEALNTVLAERADGTRVLTITSKIGQLDIEFSPQVWERLSDTARWHERRLLNGVHKGAR